jgi:hypothetical protein
METRIETFGKSLERTQVAHPRDAGRLARFTHSDALNDPLRSIVHGVIDHRVWRMFKLFSFLSLGVFGGAKAVRPACIAAPFRLNPERRRHWINNSLS